MPFGTYDYKFIVDGIWRHSIFDEMREDPSGNINNFIVISPTKKKNKNNNLPSDNSYVSLSYYSSQYLPSKRYMYSDANPLPINYMNIFTLENCRLKEIFDREKFLNKTEYSNHYTNTSYTKCFNFPPHVNM